MNSDIGMRVIFVRSVLFSSFLTLQICVCTHLKGCAGCLVFFFFSFTMSNLVVVEKHLGFGYLLIVLHSFFFLQLHLL